MIDDAARPSTAPERPAARERPEPRTVPFYKLHGLGNDYVFLDLRDGQAGGPTAELARRLADRHRGVGGDGLIVLLPPREGGDVRMRMFNADGSEAETCGNGIRCVVRLAVSRGLRSAAPMTVETGAGPITCHWSPGPDGGPPERVEVDMGRPEPDPARVPVDVSRLEPLDDGRFALEAAGERLEASFCSMGNPHAVVELPDAAAVAAFPLERIGPAAETHPAFPERMNVHVAAAVTPAHLVMRTWERGSGITEACGTGACAVAAVLVRRGRAAAESAVDLPGGRLRIRIEGDGARAWMDGPAETVCSGRIDLPPELFDSG